MFTYTNMNAIDVEMMKKPMVYIRVIEMFFALICFCCVVAFSVCVEVKITCTTKNHKTITNTTGFCIDYPFALSDVAVNDICSGSTYPAYILTVDYDSQSEFFVAVGVISMLFSTAVLVFYIKFWDKYNYTTYFPFPDLLITFTLASFWFSSTCSWASAVTSLSQYADYDSVLETVMSLTSCQGIPHKLDELFVKHKVSEFSMEWNPNVELSSAWATNSCSLTPGSWSFGTLVFSVVLGFVNVCLWYWNSFLLFRNLKHIKVEEQKRLDAVTAAVDYPGHGDNPTPIRDSRGPTYGSSQSNKPVF